MIPLWELNTEIKLERAKQINQPCHVSVIPKGFILSSRCLCCGVNLMQVVVASRYVIVGTWYVEYSSVYKVVCKFCVITLRASQQFFSLGKESKSIWFEKIMRQSQYCKVCLLSVVKKIEYVLRKMKLLRLVVCGASMGNF